MYFAIDFITTFLFVIGNTALVTFVAVQAWNHRPARIFILVVGGLIGIEAAVFAQTIAQSPAEIYLVRSFLLAQLGPFTAAFVALISAMFMPVWWEGRRPIIWILLPYVLLSILISIDIFAQMGIFINGMQFSTVDTSSNITDLGLWLMIAFTLSWLVPLGVLGVAFVRDRRARPPIIVLSGSLLLTIILMGMGETLRWSPVLRGLLYLIPISLGLAFAVFRTRLITPLRAAIDQAFDKMSDVAIVLDSNEQIVYANARANELGFHAGTTMASALTATHNDALADMRVGDAPQHVEVGGRKLTVSLGALEDRQDQRIGTLVLGRDITEVEERTVQLELERAHLAEAVSALRAEQQERATLAATVQAMALPVIPITDGVLVLPLVGIFDTARMGNLRDRLLEAIERQRARLVILDLTGLLLLDAEGASGLTKSIQAARLIGARCMLVGLRPEIAETIVAQDLQLGDVPTAATLQAAVSQALRQPAQAATLMRHA